MEAKYYTPTIEEFHVGFEFESNYTLFQKGNKSDVWNKCVLTKENPWFWEAYYNDAVECEFRVKLLDREDIEKCLENKYILFTFDNDIVTLEINNQIKFIGKCKNKSELKKIVEFIEY